MSRKVGLERKAWLDFVGDQTNKPGAGGGPVNFRDTLGALVDDWQLIPSGGRNMGGREAGQKIITCLPIRPGWPTPLQSMTSPATQWPPALVKAGLSSTLLKGSIFFSEAQAPVTCTPSTPLSCPWRAGTHVWFPRINHTTGFLQIQVILASHLPHE